RGVEVPLEPEQQSMSVGGQGSPATVQLPSSAVADDHATFTRVGSSLLVTSTRPGCEIARAASRGNWQEFVRGARFFVNGGDRFTVGDVGLLALDALTNRTACALAAHCGRDTHDDVDRALAATTWSRMIWLRAGREARGLVAALHSRSFRRGYPLVSLNARPADSSIDEVCLEAGCGVLVLDLTRPWPVPEALTRNLFAPFLHLWTIVVGPTTAAIRAAFGNAWYARPSGVGHEEIGFGLRGSTGAASVGRFG
ncbi:MAG: hypothetical protein ABIY55_20145, partial [Kofleriaceae bacterium]